MALDSPALCEPCGKRLRCQREGLACNALLMFRRGHSLDRCRLAPRQPSAEFAAQLNAPLSETQARIRAPSKWREQVAMRELADSEDYDGEERRKNAG